MKLLSINKGLMQENVLIHYKGLVRVKYNPDFTMTEVANMIRSLETVTIVTNVSHDEANGIAVYSVKVLSKDKGLEAFQNLKQLSLTKLPEVHKFEIGVKTIKRVD